MTDAGPTGTVPSLFRMTLISATKRRNPTLNEIPAQRHDRRYRYRRRKSELYYDATGSQLTATNV